MGIMYLVQPGQLLDTKRFKVGSSEHEDYSRLSKYHKNCKIISIRQCGENYKEIEKIIINEFKNKNKYKLITGNEYFEGDIKDIEKDFNEIISKEIDTDDLDDNNFKSNIINENKTAYKIACELFEYYYDIVSNKKILASEKGELIKDFLLEKKKVYIFSIKIDELIYGGYIEDIHTILRGCACLLNDTIDNIRGITLGEYLNINSNEDSDNEDSDNINPMSFPSKNVINLPTPISTIINQLTDKMNIIFFNNKRNTITTFIENSKKYDMKIILDYLFNNEAQESKSKLDEYLYQNNIKLKDIISDINSVCFYLPDIDIETLTSKISKIEYYLLNGMSEEIQRLTLVNAFQNLRKKY